MEQSIASELAALGFLDEEALQSQPALLQAVTRHQYARGEVLYQHGSESLALFVIVNGLVKMQSHLPNGRTRIVRLHREGSFIGLDGLINQSHEHTVIALTDTEVLQLPHQQLCDWQEHAPQLYMQLLEKWNQYLSYADTWITDFSTGNIKGRVARLIQFLAKFDDSTGPQIVELLTTEEMSEILGVTPESVSRVIAEFKRSALLNEIENNTESLFTVDQDQLKETASVV